MPGGVIAVIDRCLSLDLFDIIAVGCFIALNALVDGVYGRRCANTCESETTVLEKMLEKVKELWE
jgi:hypothetical protein